MRFPPFEVDLGQERLCKNGKELPLRRKPFAILRYLLANPKRLVTHEDLRVHVWSGSVVSDSAVRTHFHELRQALGEDVIETVIGRGYRFVATIADGDERTEPPPAQRDSLVVGRDAELASLHAALERARAGQRQLCFVLGEPGIGKTTLVETFLEQVVDANVLAARGQCVEQYGSPEAYFAVIELLVRLRATRDGQRVITTLLKFAPTFLAQVPHLIPDGKLDETLARARGGTDAKLVREIVEAIEDLCAQQTMIVVLEDLQWSDVATIDLINTLHQRRERANLLVIATSRRAEAQTPAHPLSRVVRSLVTRAGAIALALEPIAAPDVARFLEVRFPRNSLPASLAPIVDRITGGTPIFVTSFIEDIVRREMVFERDGTWQLAVSLDELAAHRPASVNQLIDIQLDQLPMPEQRLLECAAIVGLEFSPAVVAAALERPAEEIDDLCDGLARRGAFLRRAGVGELPDGTTIARYAFLHGLVLEACLVRGGLARRQHWHRRIAEMLERAHGARAADIANVLAAHFENGHDLARAVNYYILAGEQNAQRFASPDAMRMYQRAHTLLLRTPPSRERDTLEIDVLGGLTQATIRSTRDVTREPLAMLERMATLARSLGDTTRLGHSLANMSFRFSVLAEYRRANAISDELEALARTETLAPPLVAFASIARLMGTVFTAPATVSLASLRELTSTGGSSLGATDRRIVLLLYQCVINWLVGNVDSAVTDVETALALARESGDPYAQGACLTNLSRTLIWRGDSIAAVRAAAEPVLAIPEAAVWHNQCQISIAWADSREAPLDRARCLALVAEFHERAARFPMGITLIGFTLAKVLRASHMSAEALALTDEMLAFGREHGEDLVLGEYLRVRGELVEATDVAAATALYLEALEASRAVAAHSLALRAALALVRVGHGGARELLPGLLAVIAEGASSPDVIAARALAP